MKNIKICTLVLSLLLTACTSAPKKLAEENDSGKAQVRTAFNGAAHQADADEVKSYPAVELSEELLYTILMAEIAAQRGQPELSARAYLEIARDTRDVRVARRAAQLAYESRQMDQTLEAFKLWNELEPKAAMPRQMLATVLLSGGKLKEAKPYLVDLLAADKENAGRNYAQIYPLFARNVDKPAVYAMLRDLAQPYQSHAEAHWVLAQAAAAAGQQSAAFDEVRQARKLKPEWELPVILEAQMLQAKSPAEALAVSKKYLQDYPDASELRLYYARLLLEQKQYQESRLQFQTLIKEQPENADLAFASALLSLQMGELERAEKELKHTLKVGRKDSATVHYYLAQLNEARKNEAVAMQEYQQVTSGEYVFPARMRMAYLLVKDKKLSQALDILHQTKARNNDQRAQLILTEGQILRDAKQYEQAYKALSAGLEKLPNHPDLLYEAALIADKQKKPVLSEELLRKLIKVAPDHAHGYNALGYSLMERNVRLPEAMELVEKAYQLSPDDAAILDSMGWGYYLLGNLSKSLEFMRRAYDLYPDAEVAAHLGEVLWKQGEQGEAKAIWQDNLKKNPDSEALKSVIRKFLP